MYYILIPENVWRPNLIFLKNLCRVHKKTHGELNFCRVPVVCRGLCLEAHGKMCVCRVPDLCREPFLLAHGKPSLCRVSDVLPTANFVAHGKHTFSGSDWSIKVDWSSALKSLPYLVRYIFLDVNPALQGPHNLHQIILIKPTTLSTFNFHIDLID